MISFAQADVSQDFNLSCCWLDAYQQRYYSALAVRAEAQLGLIKMLSSASRPVSSRKLTLASPRSPAVLTQVKAASFLDQWSV